MRTKQEDIARETQDIYESPNREKIKHGIWVIVAVLIVLAWFIGGNI